MKIGKNYVETSFSYTVYMKISSTKDHREWSLVKIWSLK